MQEIDVDLERVLRQAYNSVVKEGKSLRMVSEETGIERKKLKGLMERILSEEELSEFTDALEARNNRKKAGKPNGRHKKERALEGEKYKMAIAELSRMGIQPESIEAIYNRCQEKSHTQIFRDTLAIKLIELLNYFSSRNEGITEESKGYISCEDVIEMILRNPRIMTSDIQNNIIAKCGVITNKNKGDIAKANMKMKSNPGIFSKTIDTIIKGR